VSPTVHERSGYRTLFERLRANVRAYIRKQLELPRQEIAEIIQANLAAAKWFGIAFVFLFAFLISFVVLLIALLNLVFQLWAAALIVLAVMFVGAGLTAYVGYRKLELHGPTRTINSMKETIRWAKARLLGRSAS
jgi:uncharacterized membrane protein YqjE